MLKEGDLARREDHQVRGSKAGEPDEIGGISHVCRVPVTSLIVHIRQVVQRN